MGAKRIIQSRSIWVDSLPSGFVSDFNPAKQAGLLSDSRDLNNKKYDAVIVGAGHNGLVAGSYLAKRGKKVANRSRHLLYITCRIILVPGYLEHKDTFSFINVSELIDVVYTIYNFIGIN